MKRALNYYALIVSTFLFISTLIPASNPTEYLFAFLYFPLVIFYTKTLIKHLDETETNLPQISFRLSSKTTDHSQVVSPIDSISPDDTAIVPEVVTTKSVKDLNRRHFLKLIGSAGVSVFFLAIFNKDAQAAFFGSVPGPGTVSLKDTSGNKIDPSEKQPTDGYNITEVDDSTPAYYGFVNKTGAWYITREDAAGSYRYTKGNSDFSTNWTNRASLTYNTFDNVF